MLSHYAKIRDDSDSERQFAEISLRAIRKIGEISRDLEKAESHGGKVWLPIAGKSKEQQLSWHLRAKRLLSCGHKAARRSRGRSAQQQLLRTKCRRPIIGNGSPAATDL